MRISDGSSDVCSSDPTAGLPTIAIRSPAHPAMRNLLTAMRKHLTAPSANASGRISPTRASHVAASLGGRIPLIVDGGAPGHGLESTIVAVNGGEIRLLRPGPISTFGVPVSSHRSAAIEAPGPHARHLAPLNPSNLTSRVKGKRVSVGVSI